MKQPKPGKQKKEVPASRTSVRKPVTAAASIPDNSVNAFIEKNAFFIALGLLLFIAFIVYKDFLFLNKLFLYKDIGSDTINGLLPPMKNTANYLHINGLPKWSFNYGMGQNIFPFFLRDPLDIFLYIGGKDFVAYGIGYKEFIKVVTGGILFFLYLRTFSLNAFTCITGSLLFAFSGFMILGGGWYMFSFEAMNMALLLLGFEKLFKNNSFVIFPIAIALIGTSMPFNLYVYGLFIAIYVGFRYIDEKGWNLKGLAILYSKVVLLGILGVAMSSFFLFSNIIGLLESPRGSGETSYFNLLSSAPVFALGDAPQNITSIMRLFSSDMMGTGINFKGWQNYLEAPIFYSGLLSLLLFPSVFQFLDRRRKIIYGIFLSIWVLPVIFPYFRYAFWLFTGDYYRAFSFFVSFTLIFLSIQALNKISRSNKIKPYVLIATTLVLLVILSLNYSDYIGTSTGIFNSELMSSVKIMLIVYAVLIYLLSLPRFRSLAQIFLIILLCFELAYFSSITVNKRSIVTAKEYESKVGYNDYSVDAIAYLKDHDKSFYRVDKDYSSGTAIHTSINDGLVQDYFGTSAYNSFNEKYYINYLQAVGLVRKGNEFDTRWAQGLSQRPIQEIIGNVKYFLTKRDYKGYNFDSIAQFGDVKLLKNRFYLPLGFTYDKVMTLTDLEKMSINQRDFMMMKAFFVDEKDKNDYKDFTTLTLKDTLSNYSWDMLRNDAQILHNDTFAVTEFGQNLFRGKINCSKKELLFISIPFDKGWSATVDGNKQELKIVDAGMMGLILDKGNHVVELTFYPRMVKEGLVVSLLSLPVYGLAIWMNRRRTKKRNNNFATSS